MKKIIYSILFLLLIIQFPSKSQTVVSGGTYSNPVIPGDFPDPTIIRVGNTYYAAGTTSDFAPDYPIYQSYDLVNWKQIGAVFNKPPAWTSDSFWAPELFYNNGTFYVYYTAKRKGDRISCIGVATTKDITKGFTDRGIIVEWGNEAIDGFVFRDDDRQLYIVWKAYGLTKGRPVELLASKLSSDGLKMVGESFSLTDYSKGWKGESEEGPCLIKHNGYYYLFTSVGGCCDNRCSYRVMVERSKDLKSGWEKCPDNPILQGGDEWKCPGHGTIVTTPGNRFYYMYHSYHKTDFEYVGRQGMLDELVWDNNTGWPRFRNGSVPSVIAELPFKGTSQVRDLVYFNDFKDDKGIDLWQWDLKTSRPEIKVDKGYLSLIAQNKGLTFFGWSPQKSDYSFESEVFTAGKYLKGICVYGNADNLIALGISDTRLVLSQVKRGVKTIRAEIVFPDNEKVFLKLESAGGRLLKFFWSVNGKEWNLVKDSLENYSFKGDFIPQWGAGERTGLMIEGDKTEKGIFTFVRVNYPVSSVPVN
jgi:xylan 1,4-beta-xylosidase